MKNKTFLAAALTLCLAAACVLAARALSPHEAEAQEAAAPLDGGSCMKCHSGKPVIAPQHAQNAHGAMGCTDCHGAVASDHAKDTVTLEKPSCGDCHEIPQGGKASVHIEVAKDGSVDASSCLMCHEDIHNAPRTVDCEMCHDEASSMLEGSMHWKPGPDGKAHNAGCTDCHADVHAILPSSDPDSSLHRSRIHEICARCHADPQNPAYNPITGDTFVPVPSYLSSIHGSKLGKVPHVASCTDCHGHHGFRRIADPQGTLSRANIIVTCGRCHQGMLEKFENGVHGQKLEQESGLIEAMTDEQYAAFLEETDYASRPPVCTSCHTSHSIQPVEDKGVFDEVQALCSKCHPAEVEKLGQSIHRMVIDGQTGKQRQVRCQDCHLDYHDNKDIRANDSVMNKRNIAEVCAGCHTETVHVEETGDTFQPVESYKESIHGKGVYDSGLYFSAGCVDCHGSHFIFPLSDPRSSLHHESVAETCGNANCHVGIHDRFELGIHGKVYLEEKEAYLALGPEEQRTFAFRGPVCTNCHISHAIKRTSDGTFFKDAIMQCGKCHEFAMATYRRSNHGKYALLGSQDVAKCYDCHGNHVNLSESEFTPEVVLERCRECHKKATMEMVSYITHLSLSEGMSEEELLGSDTLEIEKARGLRVLRVVRMLMEMLLISVFAFFWLHTILWLVRGTVERITSKTTVPLEKKTEYFRRLDAAHRILHVFVIVSFLGLALTGLPIKYPHHEWSAVIFGALDSIFQGNGGQVARVLHRIFAIITFGYLATHLLVLFVRSIHAYHERIMARCARCPVDMSLPPEARDAGWYAQWLVWALPVAALYIPLGALIWLQDRISGNGRGWRAWLARAFGPESMLPRFKDLRDMLASFRWFFWLGPRPRWDRWTYFEKFDYWAVFWGVAVIGLSGLCIWFKEFFTATLGLPGWAINVAMEVHSHEALLATAFIFSIHFFNTHLKPDKFPMDKVIFTGRISRHELEHERPEQYRRLVESGALDGLRTTRPALWLRVCGTLFGASAVITGIALVVWIVRMEWNNLFHGF